MTHKEAENISLYAERTADELIKMYEKDTGDDYE